MLAVLMCTGCSFVCMQRYQLAMSVTNGGYLTIKDLDSNSQNTHFYNGSTITMVTEFIFDFTPALHCSVGGSRRCSPGEVLFDIGPAVVRSGNISISWGGWSDSPAGISSYNLELYRTEKRGAVVCEKPSSRQLLLELPASSVQGIAQFSLQLNVSAAYSVILAVNDQAGNVRYSRRSLLFDDRSSIEISPTHPLTVTSAWHSQVNNQNVAWQPNLNKPITIDGVGHFFNTLLVSNGWLKPLCNFSADIESDYDQQLSGGLLPRAGTHSSEGVSQMHYAVQLNPNKPLTPPNPADFSSSTNVALANLSLTAARKDSDEIAIWLKATDLHGQSKMDSIALVVDSSAPELQNIWLAGGLQLFGSDDFSKLQFSFEAHDPHSGLEGVKWSIGTSSGGNDIGHGNVPLQSFAQVSGCFVKRAATHLVSLAT